MTSVCLGESWAPLMLSEGLANTDAPLVTVICSPLHQAAVLFRLSIYVGGEQYRGLECEVKGNAIPNHLRRPFRLHISFQTSTFYRFK